ncbi:MAG: hypothetical protein NC098_05490 [Lachnoclostridium sp.]|nr:hypothetical protein [Lachnoclostridium sp.]
MKKSASRLRNYFMTLVAIICCMSMTSCDDEDNYGNPIIGRWQLIAPTNVDYNEYYFYPDGTGAYYISDAWGQDMYYFDWNTYGDQLTIYFDNGDIWNYGWTVQGYNLYLYPDNSGIPLVYQYY